MKTTLFFVMAAAMAWAQAPAADPVVITVGTEKITRSMFEAIIASLNDQQRATLEANPEARKSLAEQIAELTAMAQEGRKRGLDQTPAYQARVKLQAEQALASAVYQDLTKTPPTDADVQAYYDAHKDEYSQAKGRHILVRFEGSRVPAREGQKDLTDAEALTKVKELREKIMGGASFADVAKSDSDDVGSGANGGDLGTFSPGEMVEAFDKVAWEIPVGTVSEPVKSDFGYHLILIEERGVKPLADVRAQIVDALRPEMGQKAIDALKEKTGITYDDTYFGAPAKEPAPEQPAN